jgi:hypothetical protein
MVVSRPRRRIRAAADLAHGELRTARFATDDEHGKLRLVRNALAHAPDGGETVQASAAEDEQVGGLALCHERLDGRAMIECSVPSMFPDGVERKLFSARSRDDPQVGTRLLGESPGDGERLHSAGGAVEAHDNGAWELLGIAARTCDQHRAGRLMEHVGGDAPAHNSGRAPAIVRPNHDEVGSPTVGLRGIVARSDSGAASPHISEPASSARLIHQVLRRSTGPGR